MAIDFDNLVLKVCEDTFALSLVIDPVKSKPGDMPYSARGIFSSRYLTIPLDNGSIISSQDTIVGIRLSEYDVIPARGDRVTVLPYNPRVMGEGSNIDAGNKFWVADCQFDGQGGATLVLRQETP